MSDYAAIQMVPYNPAWVANSATGPEVNIFGASGLAGNNAYYFDKGWVLSGYSGQAYEGSDYVRDRKKNIKHIWANMDVLGPAISFTHKHEHHIGVYSRYRQIVRGGGIASGEMAIIGDQNNPLYYEQPLKINNAGFTVHAFGELGFTYGRTLVRDDYNFVKVGATVKYLAGFAAASIYTNSITYERKNADSLAQLTGDLTAAYTYNLNPFVDVDASNDMNAWFDRAGRGGLGLDIGIQYQYHPDGDYADQHTDYLFSIAASLTDLGSVKYIADSGSANYRAVTSPRDINFINKQPNEDVAMYFIRQVRDSALSVTESFQTFKVALPTAFRLNVDWNVMPRLNMAVNLMLNMKGNNGTIYNPGYVSYVNLTPSYGVKNLRIGLPLTFIGRQTVAAGVLFRLGPVYAGSNSLISSVIMAKDQIRNFDAFVGLSFKLPKAEDYYWYR